MAISTAPLHVARASARAGMIAAMVSAAGSALAAPDLALMGKPLFEQKCGGCHEIGLGARNVAGPSLNGLFGMPAGNRRGYTYSTAMRRSAVVWTHKSFDTFIANPQAAIPGTDMAGPRIGSDADRQAIAAYIGGFDADGTLRAK